MTVRWIY